MILEILQDGFFAAIAAIGFSSISQPPMKAYPVCALLAAVGHSIRFILMSDMVGMNIVMACLFASLSIGFLAIPLAQYVHCPAATFSFPSLLPMIPGMYAYRTIQSLVDCLQNKEETLFMHDFYLLAYNGLITLSVITIMVIGVTVPIFIFKRLSFRVTKQ
jgi:uncharacterized membrane protein YjjB (DUF3815 family)